jgi:hypothetical protein
MRTGINALLLLTTALSVRAAQLPPCPADSPWDDTREALSRDEQQPGFVPIASVDDGNLLAAMNEWFDARSARDAERLESMIVPLAIKDDDASRSWVQLVLRGAPYDVARPLLAQVDASSPGYALVLSEVTARIAGQCSMSVMACSWMKHGDKWMVLPDGPRIVR